MEPPKEEEEDKKPPTEKEAAAVALAAQVAVAEQKPGTTDSLRKSTESLPSESPAEPPFKPNDFL